MRYAFVIEVDDDDDHTMQTSIALRGAVRHGTVLSLAGCTGDAVDRVLAAAAGHPGTDEPTT